MDNACSSLFLDTVRKMGSCNKLLTVKAALGNLLLTTDFGQQFKSQSVSMEPPVPVIICVESAAWPTPRLPVKIGVQSFVADLGDLLGLSRRNVVEKAAQVDARVKRAQLLLVQVQHLVHTSLVLQLHRHKGHENASLFISTQADKLYYTPTVYYYHFIILNFYLLRLAQSFSCTKRNDKTSNSVALCVVTFN